MTEQRAPANRNAGKKRYDVPRLAELGAVTVLTRGSEPGFFDGFDQTSADGSRPDPGPGTFSP